ncbi:hypothetical protein B9479_005951 [Cryptococcus floricola]|uniref:Uncharacterized protein n=1 Tax=Cryptococcus floricola TaxID=2591691 RepID=A0A5D3ARQ6_9TREE|nr:hypothetical protein B9479_005951 [Cryptococcus floricola]
MADPNFPPNLSIRPLLLQHSLSLAQAQSTEQADAIATYGIAGRVWEATRPLLEYLTLSQQYDPACPVFLSSGPRTILELGSGQSVASLHLAEGLTDRDTVIVTDLPSVMPLCEKCIESWEPPSQQHARVVARPLAWGESVSDVTSEFGSLTHILMCDLVYFPHLYPLLLHTLLSLTEPKDIDDIEGTTFGPDIILSYLSRTLALEESFFDALARYFHMSPVRGGDWEAKVFICRRWKVTKEWALPGVKDVMNGGKGVVRGRSYDLIDELFGALDWDA